MISNVPIAGPANNDAARRFINLVDEFYDRSVNWRYLPPSPYYRCIVAVVWSSNLPVQRADC